MPVFRIRHITRYAYETPVSESVNEIRIYPHLTDGQEVLQHEVRVSGDPEIHTHSDYWGNRTGCFNILGTHSELTIDSRLVVRTRQESETGSIEDGGLSVLRQLAASSLQLIELATPDSISRQKDIASLCNGITQSESSVRDVVEACSAHVFRNFTYRKGITDIETTVDEILEHQGGVCQDFAHVLLQMLRTIGIPCRYVSGYICPNKNGMRGEGATHAWVEAYIPGRSWHGIDPTNNVWVQGDHVKLAVGRNFKDCTPVKGTYRGSSRQALYVHVSVGYEDGHTFEETTEVRMEATRQDGQETEKEQIGAAQQ